MVWLGDKLITIPPPPPERTPEEKHAQAVARGCRCAECPLYNCDRGPVLPTIRPGAPVLAVGEAPGSQEVKQGEGFVGPSGRIVRTSLADGGVGWTETSISNTILCQPPPDVGSFTEFIEKIKSDYRRAYKRWERQWRRPEDAQLVLKKRTEVAFQRYVQALASGQDVVPPPPPPVFPQDACRPRLERDIAEAKTGVILTLGKQALTQIGDILGLNTVQEGDKKQRKLASLKKQHGAPVLLPDGRVFLATFHPAFAMRDKCEYMPVIRDNIKRAASIARRHGKLLWNEPEFLLNPTPEVIHRTLDLFLGARARVTVDIETDGIDAHAAMIRCVGLGAVVYGQETVICIPFNHMDGTPWWSDDETKVSIALHLRRVLDECSLVFQNGQFDTTALLRVGLMTNRTKTWFDSMVGHHDTPDNDLPHDLGFIAKRYFEVPLWKTDVDHKAASSASDYHLHRYNCLDVLTTMRIAPKVWAQIVEHNTQPQFETDTRMLPLIRDMSEMGLFVNEWKRGEYSAFLNKQCYDLRRQFVELAGKPVNPRSPQQLRELLYVDWNYDPVLGGGALEWNEEENDREEGSTSNGALTRLMKERRMDPQHAAAVECLLKFRANDKLRGTYVDNLKTYPIDFSSAGLGDVGYANAVQSPVYDPETDLEEMREVMPRRPGLSLARTTFKNHVVPTGRMASGDPVNFQNIPKFGRGGLNMRDMYVAPPGHVIVGADYEQVEARLYAQIAQDRLLLHAIGQKLDLHSLNYASLAAKPGDNIIDVYYWLKSLPKDELGYFRTVAKRFCFLKIYGGQKKKLYSVMIADRNKSTGELVFPNLQEKECWEWSDNWDRLHPETLAWHKRCHAAFNEYGFTGVPMIDFRKRFFPGGVAQVNAIPNLTIQGSAASIANRAALALAEAIPFRKWSRWSGMVLQVHDYLAVIVPESRAYEAAAIVQKCMYYEKDGMKYEAFPEISWTWGQQ